MCAIGIPLVALGCALSVLAICIPVLAGAALPAAAIAFSVGCTLLASALGISVSTKDSSSSIAEKFVEALKGDEKEVEKKLKSIKQTHQSALSSQSMQKIVLERVSVLCRDRGVENKVTNLKSALEFSAARSK